MNKNIVKRAMSFMLAMIIATTSLFVVSPSKPAKAYSSDSGYHTGSTTAPYLDRQIGTSRNRLINELLKNKRLYNRTRFARQTKPFFTRRNTMNIGNTFNCTGFVMTALERSGANLNKIKSPSGGYLPISNLNRFSRYVVLDKRAKSYKYSSVSALLRSGRAEKGDIIIMQPKDWSVGYKDAHVGIFWGNNPRDNKFWHHTGSYGNAITRIFGYVTNPVYYLVKLSPSNSTATATGKARIESITNNYEPITGMKFQLLDKNKKPVTVKGTSTKGYRKTSSGGVYMYTNPKGFANIINLPVGQYYIRQVNKISGYKKRTSDRPIYIQKSSNRKIARIYNERKAGTAIVRTYTNNNVTLKHINMEVLDSNKRPIRMSSSKDFRYRFNKNGDRKAIWTDVNGIAVISNLPTGRYYLRQINKRNAFVKETRLIPFTIQTDRTKTVKLNNPRVAATINLVGKNDKNAPLQNIKVQLLDSNKRPVRLSVYKDYRYMYNPKGNRTVSWLDKAGITSFSGLPKGTYYIRQLSTRVNHQIVVSDLKLNLKENRVYRQNIINKKRPVLHSRIIDKIVSTII